METTYYSVHFSIDPKVTGISNADVQCEIPSKYRNQQYYKIINFLCNTEIGSFWKTMGQYPDFQMDLEFVKLKKKAILTDFLDMSPVLRWTFLVSERAISLMNSANVSSFKNYKVNLWSFDGELIPGYTFIYCPPLDYTTVDFDQSVFLTGIAKKRVLKIHSPIEFENAVSRRSLCKLP